MEFRWLLRPAKRANRAVLSPERLAVPSCPTHVVYMTHVLLLGGLILCACGGEVGHQPARSPTTDYPPPPPRHAHGRGIGADNVAPEDRLAESPTVGSEGAEPAARPGDDREGAGSDPSDPCRQIGLTDQEGRSRCREPRPTR